MKRTAFFTLLAVLVVTCVMAGCGDKAAENGAADGGAGNGGKAESETSETREVKVGEEFTIELESNPSTGYRWTMTTRPDESILGLTGDYYEAPETDAVGAPGKQFYRFKALKAGQTTMAFQYARSFEPDQPPVQAHTVSVTVR